MLLKGKLWSDYHKQLFLSPLIIQASIFNARLSPRKDAHTRDFMKQDNPSTVSYLHEDGKQAIQS